MNRIAKLVACPLLGLQVIYFAFVAFHRFVHVDEGFYLLASRMVMAHKSVYLDFFFQQAPLLPYIYAFWMAYFGTSWISARLLSAILSACVGLIIYVHVSRETERWFFGVCGIAIFSGTTLVFAFYPTATPYSLAGLFLVSAYVMASRAVIGSAWMAFGSGLALALAINTRSYLVILLPLFLWWLAKNSQINVRRKLGMLFILGLVFGLAPSIYFFVRSPGVFLFDNLGYHALRTKDGLVGLWSQKLDLAFQLFLGNGITNGLQWSLLVFLCFGLWVKRNLDASSRFAAIIAIMVAAVSILPTPAFPQYFSLCIPFMIISVTCGVSQQLSKVRSMYTRQVEAIGWALLAVLYVASSASGVRMYLLSYDNARTPAFDKRDWSLRQIEAVGSIIDEIALPGEVVASFWPGDIFATRASPLPGLEDDEGLRLSGRLSPEECERYHILSWAEIEASFAAHRPRIVIVRSAPEGGELYQRRGEGFKSLLERDDYTLYRSLGGISIYRCCANP